MEFVWALLVAVGVVFCIHFGKEAYDCHAVGGVLVQTVIPLEYACVNVRN